MKVKGWLRTCMVVAVTTGALAAATAHAAPARRGPVIEVIRPGAEAFPLRARTEVRGPVQIAHVVAEAWVGPRLVDEWRPSASPIDTARSWIREEPSSWERLKAERDARFESAGGLAYR